MITRGRRRYSGFERESNGKIADVEFFSSFKQYDEHVAYLFSLNWVFNVPRGFVLCFVHLIRTYMTKCW